MGRYIDALIRVMLMSINLLLVRSVPPSHLYMDNKDMRFILDHEGWIPLRYIRTSKE